MGIPYFCHGIAAVASLPRNDTDVGISCIRCHSERSLPIISGDVAWESRGYDLSKSRLKSFNFGLNLFIKSIFLFLDQDFICFSLLMASVTLSP